MSDYPITAFPTTESNWINENVRTEGMTLRDYFAAKAMQSIIHRYEGKGFGGNAESPEFIDAAEQAYFMADAMLRARNQ